MHKELAPNDTFNFQCRMCGGCCRDDREIILNPQDVFSISRALSMSTSEFIERHCDCETDSGFGPFPLLTLKTPGGNCYFLQGPLCAIHDLRPACCRNYPVGSMFSRSGETRDILMPPAPGCQGFSGGPEYCADSWKAEARIGELEPGICLMRRAFTGFSGLPADDALKNSLYKILCDFDPVPAQGESAPDVPPLSPQAAMEILSRRLDALKRR